MPAPDVFNSPVVFTNTVSMAQAPSVPGNWITDAMVMAGTGIAYTKLQHMHALCYSQLTGTAVVAGNATLWIARNPGTIVGVQAAITGALANDASRHVTVDVKKNGTTILTGTIDLTSSSTLRVAVSGVLAATTYLVGDVFEAYVAVSGGSGVQAQGVAVTLAVAEVGL